MIGRGRWWSWGSAIVTGLLLAGLGGVFVRAGLDTADKLGSVIGALAAVIGLGCSAYGVVLARRALASPAAVPARQRVDRVDAGAGVEVVDGAAGGEGEQSVTNVRTGGAVRVIRGVSGNVDIAP
jgi:hypothetical protein